MRMKRLLIRATAVALLLAAGWVLGAPKAGAADELVIAPHVAALFEKYKKRAYPLFFAVSPDGFFVWYVYCRNQGGCNKARARNEALLFCGRRSRQECVILAAGKEVELPYRVATTPLPPCDLGRNLPPAAAAVAAGLRPDICRDLTRYRANYGHFRAFAMSDLAEVDVAWNWAYDYKTAEQAVKSAVAACERNRRDMGAASACRLFAIGDIVVLGMDEAAVKAAIAVYGDDKEATNADLSAGN